MCKSLRTAFVAVLLLSSLAAADDSVAYNIIQGLLLKHDADHNGTLDPAERAKVARDVAKQYGPGGTQILNRLLTAADTDRDGRLSTPEWQALGRKVAKGPAGVTKETLMVPMPDGVRLATDVYRPAGAGPWPVILSRTPYNKAGGGTPGALVRAGYVVVKQDMRGRFASEGENLPFIACGWGEHSDGADTVAWLVKQKWCNGKVGTVGASALGITQNLMAPTRPAGLTCQYIAVAAGSLYHHATYVGGALRKSQVEGWLRSNRFDPKALSLYAAHPAYDEFWQGYDAVARAARTNTPAVHFGGWFDTFSQGTVDAFVARQTRGGPGAKGNQKLVMGPWTHGGFRQGGRVGELTFPHARMPAQYGSDQWFAYWLQGAPNGADRLPPVAYYVMGDTSDPRAPGNQWRFAKAWPIPHKPTPFYFHADGSLQPTGPAASDGKPARRTYTFDPAKPCPTVGGCNLNLPAGPRAQNRIESRPDVLTFTTVPLAEPVEVTGNPRAVVFLASDAVDTDLSVRFCDVYPNGKSYLLSEGMLRVRYRGGFEKPRLLTPGETVEVRVPCWPTSVIVNKGHRIRLTVTGSNYPRFDVNPGTGRPWRPDGQAVRQTNHIFCDGAARSRVILPVVAPGT